jgi:6-pyruvoyltetrahydropterin/6-carboxytetrahydropterin synthase
VAVLPIDNSTAERLAEWLAGRLQEEIRQMGASNVRSIAVEVEEAPGQSARFELTL